MAQAPIDERDFETARPARPVYCHQEFLDKLTARRAEPIGKRTALLMQKMAVDIERLHYKATSGVNRGWRRSRLGGSSGSHFYAWWAPGGAAPLKPGLSFEAAEPQAVFLRDIRHHDDHDPLAPGNLNSDYLPMSVPDLRGGDYAPEPWTQPQVRFARGRSPIRILKGHPGSGKTTALLHAADASQAEHVLYLTFSQDLAALAREYFDRFCSNTRTFTVMTIPMLLRELTSWRGAAIEPGQARLLFQRDLQNHLRSIGPWSKELDALYDEMHAHLVGAAVPEQSGRFAKAERIHLPYAAYVPQRSRYLGLATEPVLEAARRLERISEAPLADRYFPELAIAWRASQVVASANPKLGSAFQNYGCVAVDEVQDLTPLEAFVVIALVRKLNWEGRHTHLLLAGDEAQTVRPTDFEWAWLNDMLHGTLGPPQEFKLTANLRSPRRIADLVNKTWDYYDYLQKQDRPSGTAYAEIDDDAADQVLYATLPTSGLSTLLLELSKREGLAMIAFDKSKLPPETLPFVLSPSEAKGLDFHSVCVVNGGPHLRRIVRGGITDGAEALTRRLAIDQLRVTLSRPTERLIWVDAAPDMETVAEVSHLLHPRFELTLPPMTVEALRTCLEEEELETEERIQRCQQDARQFVAVKPDLAWSRAHQAVALLGIPGDVAGISDPATRESAYMTMSEVCFQLAIRKKVLSPELGRPDLYKQAADGARGAGRGAFASALYATGLAEQTVGVERLNKVANAIQLIVDAREQLPAWFTVEFSPRATEWLEDMDRNLEAGDNPLLAQRLFPSFFDALGLPDAQARKDRLAQRSVQILMKSRRFAQALTILEQLEEPKPKLAAECYEETGQLAKAAELYLQLNDREKALKCYRSIPDFAAALDLVRQIEGHPARVSLEWLSELETVVARRPDNFNRTMTAPEKKLLESTMERALGVQRKKPAKKTAVKKTVGKATKETPVKRPDKPKEYF